MIRAVMLVLAVFLAAAAGGAVPGRAAEGSPYAASLPLEEARERRQINNDWLANIPDYEMRLYERVSTVKNGQIKLMRAVVIGFVALLLLLIGLFVWVARMARVVRPMAVASAVPGVLAPPQGPTLVDRARLAECRWQLAAIARRQKRIDSMVSRMETALQEGAEANARLAEALKHIRKSQASLQSESETVAARIV